MMAKYLQICVFQYYILDYSIGPDQIQAEKCDLDSNGRAREDFKGFSEGKSSLIK